MSSKKLTISQIAKLAGVSKATVSRVLNDHPHIRPKVREKVQSVIEETGYRRNYMARMLASERSNIIGFIVPNYAESLLIDPFFPALTQGIARIANDNELTVSLFILNSKEDRHTMLNHIRTTGMIDGLITVADIKSDPLIPELVASDIPFVQVGRPETHTDVINFVDADNVNGGFIATEYLIQRGYKRIGMIGSKRSSAGDDRLKGYRQAIEKYNIAYDEGLIVCGDYSIESGVKGMEELLPAKPEALFIASDSMALGALRALRTHDMHVPDDIAIVGYDDLPPALLAVPQLTTVHQPVQRMGELALETLIGLINEPQAEPTQMVVDTHLVVRESTR